MSQIRAQDNNVPGQGELECTVVQQRSLHDKCHDRKGATEYAGLALLWVTDRPQLLQLQLPAKPGNRQDKPSCLPGIRRGGVSRPGKYGTGQPSCLAKGRPKWGKRYKAPRRTDRVEHLAHGHPVKSGSEV